MKLEEELLIFTKYKDTEYPFKFYSLAWVTFVLISFGGGIVFGVLQTIRLDPSIRDVLLGLVMSGICFALASWTHTQAKKYRC